MKNMIKKILSSYVLSGIIYVITFASIVLDYLHRNDLEWNESFWWITSTLLLISCIKTCLTPARPRRKKQNNAEEQSAEPGTDVNDTKTT